MHISTDVLSGHGSGSECQLYCIKTKSEPSSTSSSRFPAVIRWDVAVKLYKRFVASSDGSTAFADSTQMHRIEVENQRSHSCDGFAMAGMMDLKFFELLCQAIERKKEYPYNDILGQTVPSDLYLL